MPNIKANNSNNLTFILTGVTGTLGSRIPLSLLEQKLDRTVKTYLPVWKNPATSPRKRIQNILNSGNVSEFIKINLEDHLLQTVAFAKNANFKN